MIFFPAVLWVSVISQKFSSDQNCVAIDTNIDNDSYNVKNRLRFRLQEPEPMITALVGTKCMHSLSTKIVTKYAAYLHRGKKKHTCTQTCS